MSEQTQNIKSQVQVRNATEADIAFIFNSWLKSYRNSLLADKISNPVYYQFQHEAIERLLKRCTVQVICSAADNNELQGYVVYEIVDGVLVFHFAYVKHVYRKLGLLKLATKSLNISEGGFYTHDTAIGNKIIRDKKLKFIYNPYLGLK